MDVLDGSDLFPPTFINLKVNFLSGLRLCVGVWGPGLGPICSNISVDLAKPLGPRPVSSIQTEDPKLALF